MAQILIVEDEERIASFVAKGLGGGPPAHGRGRRAGGPRRGALRPLRPDGARHRAARAGRLRGARPAARPGQPHAGHRAHRPRLGQPTRSRRWTAAPTTTWPSPSASPSCSRACGCGCARRRRARRRPRGHAERRRRPARPSHPPGAQVGGRELDLSAREFALAEIFMLNPGQVLTREQLLDHVWGYDFDPGSNVVDVYVGYLRRKLGSEHHHDRARGRLPVHRVTSESRVSRSRRGLAGQHGLEGVDDLVRRGAGRGVALRATP